MWARPPDLPLKQATLLQQLDAVRVGRERPQEEEVVLAQGGDEAVALQAPLGLLPRGQRQPGHHVLHQLLQVALQRGTAPHGGTTAQRTPSPGEDGLKAVFRPPIRIPTLFLRRSVVVSEVFRSMFPMVLV